MPTPSNQNGGRGTARLTFSNGRLASDRNRAQMLRAENKRIRYRELLRWSERLRQMVSEMGSDFEEERAYLYAASSEQVRATERIRDRLNTVEELVTRGITNG